MNLRIALAPPRSHYRASPRRLSLLFAPGPVCGSRPRRFNLALCGRPSVPIAAPSFAPGLQGAIQRNAALTEELKHILADTLAVCVVRCLPPFATAAAAPRAPAHTVPPPCVLC